MAQQPRTDLLDDASKAILGETLTVPQVQPPQIAAPHSTLPAEVPPVTSNKEWINEMVGKLDTLVAAAEALKSVLGKKIEARRVQVLSSTNPAVRNAIRRLFALDSDTVTYEMFKQALAWRSELTKEGSK